MKRNIGKLAANIAAAGVLLGAVVVWADDQQGQQSSTSSDPAAQQQAGQSSSSTSATSSDQSSTTGAAGAQTPGERLDAAISQAASDPQQFIKMAYQVNLAEVKAGQLGQQKAQNQQTKDFAQSLVQDHQQALDQLKKLADQKNVQVSDQLDARHQRMNDELSSLSGQDFDKKFMSQQIRSHKRAIALYQAAAKDNTDSDVKQFAQQNVAGLQHHLQMAQQEGGISEPAGAPNSSDQKDQGQKDQQGQQGASSATPDQSGQSAQPQSTQPQSAQPDQSGQSAQPK